MYYGYVRVSSYTQGQKGISLDIQEKYLRQQADLLGLEFILKREVESGKNLEGRAVLTELIKTLKKDDVLGVYDDSRLSRNTEDSIKIAVALASKGAKLQVGGRFVDVDNPTDEFTYIINSAVAQYQRKIQNAKAQASIKVQRDAGNYVIAGSLYGYDLSRKKGRTIATINESEARVIKYIHSQFQAGKNLYSISTTVGLKIGRCRVILLNPIYMGKFQISKIDRCRHPEAIREEDMIDSNIYPPIIDADTYWKSVRLYRISHKPKDYSYRKSVNEFSGVYKGYCCGAGMVSVHYTNRDYHYYGVTNHRPTCQIKMRGQVRADDIEHITRALMLLTLKSGLEVATFYNEQRALLYGSIEEVRQEIIGKEKELRENDAKIARLIDLAAEGVGIDIFKGKLASLKEEEQKIKNTITELKATVAAKEGSIDELIQAENEESIDKYLMGDKEERRNFYFRHIKSAIVYPDRIEILFINLKKFIVTRRKQLHDEYLSFRMFFNGEEQNSGRISTKDGTISFIPVKTKDEFVQWTNSYYDKLAKEVNEELTAYYEAKKQSPEVDDYKGCRHSIKTN